MSARAVYLDGAFGVLQDSGSARPDVAVLLLAPFGWEEMASYRARRAWAEELASAGRPALRLDLPGTGDSAGGPGDDDLVAAWLAAVTRAAGWLRATTGAGRVAAIGAGLGGLLAMQARLGGAAIDDLVLWGVPGRGRTFVRELRAFARLEASGHAAQGAPPDEAVPEGALAAAGYVIGAATRAALEAIDLRETAPFGAGAPRVLILDRDGVSADPELPDALERAGAQVTRQPGQGHGLFCGGDMQRVEIPRPAFAAVSAWLDGAPRAVAPPHEPGVAPTAAAPPDEPDGVCAPGEAATLELATPEGRARETPLTLRGPVGELAAVLAEPADRPAELCLVLLNAGPQRRIGPNRMWVEMARRWAPRGVATLRLDSAGIGDSDGPSMGWEQEPLLYAPERLTEVRAALDALVRRGLPERFVVGGLCSGANWAFHTAIEDPRVTGAILLNPRALFWHRWMRQGRDERVTQAITERGTWRRILRGEIPPRRLLAALGGLLRHVLLVPLRSRGGAREARADQLGRALDRLAASRTRLLVVFSDREPLRDRLAAEGDLDRLAAAPGVQVQTVATAAEMHTLPALWLQDRVNALVDDELAAHVAAPVSEPAG